MASVKKQTKRTTNLRLDFSKTVEDAKAMLSGNMGKTYSLDIGTQVRIDAIGTDLEDGLMRIYVLSGHFAGENVFVTVHECAVSLPF